jgi:hypothetical protein
MTGCMSTMETLLGLPPLQLVVEDCTASAILKNQTGDILQFSRWHRKISQFYWLLPTVCYLWRYLIGNIWWNISAGRSETEAWLPSDGLKLYTDGSLFEGRADFRVFSEELDLKASFALRSPLSFRLRFTPLWLVPTTLWGRVWLVKRSAFARTVGPLYWR